jgi:hypothetical protein
MQNRPQPGSHHLTYVHAAPDERRAKPAPRRDLRALPVALGVVAGVALVILVASLLSHRSAAAPSPSFTSTARQLCDDLSTQRYDDLYNLLSPAQQQIGSRDQFVAAQRQLDAQFGATRACVYSAAASDSSHVTLMLSLTRGTASATTAQAQLTYEQQRWRVSDYDSSLVAAPDIPGLN